MKYMFLGLLIVGQITLATPAAAYKVTATKATAVAPDTTLFTITYTMGFLNRDTLVPLIANSNLKRDVSFSVIDATGTAVTTGKNAGMVLSTAPIKDAHYVVPRGTVGTFTLMVLHKNADTAPKALAVTDLPFQMIDNKTTVLASVPDESLTPFKTPLSK
jgi:hypothetical protein